MPTNPAAPVTSTDIPAPSADPGGLLGAADARICRSQCSPPQEAAKYLEEVSTKDLKLR